MSMQLDREGLWARLKERDAEFKDLFRRRLEEKQWGINLTIETEIGPNGEFVAKKNGQLEKWVARIVAETSLMAIDCFIDAIAQPSDDEQIDIREELSSLKSKTARLELALARMLPPLFEGPNSDNALSN